MKSKYKIIQTTQEVRELVANCKATGYASVDWECPLKYHDIGNDVWILGVSFQPGSAWIIPCHHSQNKIPKKRWLKWLHIFGREIIENPNVIKIAWNLKFEYKWFMVYGHIMKGVLLDGMLA